MRPPISRAGAEAGYTFATVLVVMVGLALAAQTAFIPSESAVRRNAEAELMFRGLAYKRAIASFWDAGGTNPRLPQRLQDLLEDPRDGRRHIRALYTDPVSDAPWTFIYGADGGITGVVSTSSEMARKTALFPKELQSFEGAERYNQWSFIFDPAESA